jgi:hypothetical protein
MTQSELNLIVKMLPEFYKYYDQMINLKLRTSMLARIYGLFSI